MVNRVLHLGTSWGGGTQASDFLARTSGLDSTHTTAYTDLINGLVTDGVWTSLDALYVFATADQTTALLSLVNSTFNATLVNANSTITFVADQGYTSANDSDYINTNFNATTASSPKFVQNSASFGFWGYDNNAAVIVPAMGTTATGATGESNLFPRYTSDRLYPCVNSPNASFVTNASTQGLICADRVNSTTIRAFRNGSQVGADITDNSQSPANGVMRVLGVAGGVYGYRTSAAYIGESLGATKQGLLYSRLRTFMTAVGVP